MAFDIQKKKRNTKLKKQFLKLKKLRKAVSEFRGFTKIHFY